MSGQIKTASVEMQDFVHWFERKYRTSVSYADDLALYPNISVDTTQVDLDKIRKSLNSLTSIEYRFDEEGHLFIRQRKVAESPSTLYRFQVLNQRTLDPIELVAASVENTSIGQYSDHNGMLALRIPKKWNHRKVGFSMVGFAPLWLPIHDLSDVHKVLMSELPIPMEPVTIADRKNPVNNSENATAMEIGSKTIAKASQILGDDILRDIQMLPGLIAHQDDDSGIRIRGSGTDQTLLMVDGIPIYNASHYFGIFGAVNSGYIDRAILYKNNIPIEYGEKNGGMLEILGLRSEKIDGYQGSIDLNLLTLTGVAQGRLDSMWTFRIGGRTTYRSVSNTGFLALFQDEQQPNRVQNFGLNETDNLISSIPDFRFYDINGNLTFSPSSNIRVAINGYKSRDNLNNSIEVTRTIDRASGSTRVASTLSQREFWESRGGSMLSTWQLTPKSAIHTDIYYASYRQQDENRIVLHVMRVNADRNFRQRVLTGNEISEIGFRSFLDGQLLPNASYKVGIELRQYKTFLLSNDITKEQLQLRQEASMMNMFSNIGYEWSDGWSATAGLRSTYYDPTQKLYWSPRLDIRKQVSPSSYLKASAGRQYQLAQNLSFENLYRRTIETWVLSNDIEIPVSTLDHLMIGGSWKKNRWLLDVEGYLRYESNITEVALNDINNSIDSGVPTILNEGYVFYHGTGNMLGVDVLAGYTGRKLSTLLSYTLSKSTVSYPSIARGVDFPSPLDSRHQVQWINDLRIKKWNFGFNIIYASGRVYTDLNKIGANRLRVNLTPEERQSRLPNYIRLDMGLGYRFLIGGLKSSFNASLINFLDRDNVSYIQYTFTLPSHNHAAPRGAFVGNTSNLIPRTLNLSWKIEF